MSGDEDPSLLRVSCRLSLHSRTDEGRSSDVEAEKRIPQPSPRGPTPPGTYVQFVEQHGICGAVGPWLGCFPKLLLGRVTVHGTQLEEAI